MAISITEEEYRQTWRPLQLLNFYRMIIAGLFVLLIIFLAEPIYIGSTNPELALYTSVSYALVSMLFSFAMRLQKPDYTIHLYLHMLVDIAAITLLIYASGGVISGIGVLLVIAIAGGSVIMASRMANMFAAIATIAILLEESYASATNAFEASYTHAGILGTTFFATAMLAYGLARRLQESEQLAKQRGIDLANLAKLNEHIIQRMQSGILVIDHKNRIRLTNNSAWVMLDVPAIHENQPLESVSTDLLTQLTRWRQTDGVEEPQVIKPSGTSSDILPRFTRLGNHPKSGTLVFLEDTSMMAKQAHQLKMASLGRLTASIAHEVRNPLGAISHAGQLLAESSNLDKPDQRLTEIINNHSDRVNSIVENILQLSRSDRSNPQKLAMAPWLDDFANEFRRDQHLNQDELAIEVEPPELEIFMDPSQLHQVLWNLCQNGIRHSAQWEGTPKVRITTGMSSETDAPYIDIIDHGPGIDTETALKIFEPFFTTESSGTGLGLYIARELCEANHARLIYIPMPKHGSCFRISFSHMNLSG